MPRPRKPIDPAIRTPAELTAWREHRGLSQASLGRLLGVTKQTVYRWEAGAVMPRLAEYALRYLDTPYGRYSAAPPSLATPPLAEAS
jgi:DNA-binding XRE family transcriptional regulator